MVLGRYTLESTENYSGGKVKTSRQKLKEKIEKLVKQQVKERDNYTCQHCGKANLEGANCHASHVIPVSASGRLQFDPLNLKALCYHCHLNWWHKNPLESGEWFRQTFPDRWEYLEKIKQEPKRPIKEFELEELYQKLKQKGGTND